MANTTTSYLNNYSGISLAITSIALLAFEYISFLGLNFFMEGQGLPIPVPSYICSAVTTIACTIVIFRLIITLCRSKASRNKRQGLPREILSAIVCLVLLSVQSTMFMKFLNIYDDKEQIVEDVYKMRDGCKGIDQAYSEYVNIRLMNFQNYTKKKYGQYGHATQESLRRRLLPEGLDSLTTVRQQWLGTLNEVSVWNILTPHNVRTLMDASEKWSNEYNDISKTIYQHEAYGDGSQYFPFEHAASMQMRNVWLERFSAIDAPDFRTFTILLVIIISILTAYLSIRRPKNRFGGTHGQL